MAAYPKPLKKKKNDYAKMASRLWFYFSQYIRLSKSTKNGWCVCISCERSFIWRSMDAGHFISIGRAATRYNENNVNPQCPWCNRVRYLDHGMKVQLLADHRAAMIKKHGSKFIDALELKSREYKNFSFFELEQLKDYYRIEVRNLKKRKNLSFA